TKIGAQFPNIGKIAHLVRENALLLLAAAALNITSVIPAYNIIANSIQCYPAVDFDNSFGVLYTESARIQAGHCCCRN
ncbi:hypothetical protein LIR08_17655, partial [Fusicatenibacter saccharivorans]|nr:hypothetical protein [Fusicatenibacter saccharivorans]